MTEHAWSSQFQIATFRWIPALGAAAALTLLTDAQVDAQFSGFGGRDQELQILGQFDADDNGRLDADERRVAREWGGLDRRGRRNAGGRRTTVPARPLTPAEVAIFPNRPLYDMEALRTFFLTFENEDWEAELEVFRNTDVEVPATLTVDGESYPDVGVHFRGNSSFQRVPTGYKRSLNLSLDWIHERADIDSYQTFNLLNSHADPTFLRSVLFLEIARHYMPAPKANFVRVAINGENWGIYVNQQQFNRDFIEEWYDTRDGARWNVPGNPRGRAGLEYFGQGEVAYRRAYDLKSDDNPNAWRALMELTRVLNETSLDELQAALEPMLDIDEVLRFLALDVALVNADGYWTRASDYNLYLDPDGRFHVIPHDANETFSESRGRSGFGGRTGSVTLDPLTGLNDRSTPLRSRLLAVPELRERYLNYVRDIAVNYLDWAVLGPIAERYQALIADDVEADVRRLERFEEFPAAHDGVGSLRSFVERRREYLLNYLMLDRLTPTARTAAR